jgi:CRISPR-associated protein Csn2
MRISYRGCGLEMELQEGELAGICMESSFMFRNFTEQLWNQSNDMEGEIFLSKGDKALKWNKEVFVNFNPYSVDLNEKKILSRVYGEMQEIADLDFYAKKSEINTAVVSMLDEIDSRLPYPLQYTLELDFQQLLKVYGVKVESRDTELIERVADYIRLAHQTLGTVLFIFVHFKDYFSRDELSGLREMIQYEQVAVLLVENMIQPEEHVNEKWWIIDKDSCIIEI